LAIGVLAIGLPAEAVKRRRLVPGVGFEPTSPHFQCGAFTRLASQAFALDLPAYADASAGSLRVRAIGLPAEAAERRRLVRTAGIGTPARNKLK
jgi:hypothetical protein